MVGHRGVVDQPRRAGPIAEPKFKLRPATDVHQPAERSGVAHGPRRQRQAEGGDGQGNRRVSPDGDSVRTACQTISGYAKT